MTIEEAKYIIAKAKPIEFPKRNNTVELGNKKITTFKDFMNYGNCRRKKRKNSEST